MSRHTNLKLKIITSFATYNCAEYTFNNKYVVHISSLCLNTFVCNKYTFPEVHNSLMYWLRGYIDIRAKFCNSSSSTIGFMFNQHLLFYFQGVV